MPAADQQDIRNDSSAQSSTATATTPVLAANAGNIAVNLDTPFLYQNRRTGQPSSSTLTVRQLCRILCPPGMSGPSPPPTTSLITPQTLLLGYDSHSHQYDSNGWRVAISVPILAETCASWHYENSQEGAASSTGGGTGVKGPVSIRVMAELQLDATTRVFGSNISSEWKRVQELPHLQLAMEAFRESKIMPTSWPEEDSTSVDVNHMTFDEVKSSQSKSGLSSIDDMEQRAARDLDDFLSSTDHLAPHAAVGNEDDDDGEEYESDGGTKYVRDLRTGNWIHEDLAPKKAAIASKSNKKIDLHASVDCNGKRRNNQTDTATTIGSKKRKRTKAKFSAKNARCWIYVTGLPNDTNEEEVANYFSKVGILDLDPETQKPKVKLYRLKNSDSQEESRHNVSGSIKGDASICYARPESVELALQILDENLFRDGAILKVERAKFEQHGSTFDDGNNNGNKSGKNENRGRRIISEAKRKVARLAALQAVGWDEGENGRIAGGLKGLRIIVLMNMFDPVDLEQDDNNDTKLRSLEKDIHSECAEFGTIEKITIFSKHPAGVSIVKFTQPNAASDAVKKLHGKLRKDGRKVEASFWDGVTDYTMRDFEREEKEAEKRLDEFGDWLDNQEVPEEFQLRVAGDNDR